MRLENILQTPEYRSRVEKIFPSHNISSQEEVDNLTEMLTNILAEGTILANSPHMNELTSRIQKKKKLKIRNLDTQNGMIFHVKMPIGKWLYLPDF